MVRAAPSVVISRCPNTNSPTDTLGIIPTGPSDDTHTTNSNINDTLVVNSDVAASPTLEEATMGPNGDTLTVNPDIAASPTPEGNAASAVDAGSHDNTHVIDSDTTASPTLKRKQPSQITDAASPTFGNNDTHVVNSDTATSPTLKRKRKYSPAQIAQRQRRRDDRRSLGAANLSPDGGNTQAGGSGGSRV